MLSYWKRLFISFIPSSTVTSLTDYSQEESHNSCIFQTYLYILTEQHNHVVFVLYCAECYRGLVYCTFKSECIDLFFTKHLSKIVTFLVQWCLNEQALKLREHVLTFSLRHWVPRALRGLDRDVNLEVRVIDLATLGSERILPFLIPVFYSEDICCYVHKYIAMTF